MSTPAARVTALCLHTAHYTHYRLGLHTGYNSWGVEGRRPSLTSDFKINGAGKVIKPIHGWLLIFCTVLANVGQILKLGKNCGLLKSAHTHHSVWKLDLSFLLRLNFLMCEQVWSCMWFDVILDIPSLMSCFQHKYSSIW